MVLLKGFDYIKPFSDIKVGCQDKTLEHNPDCYFNLADIDSRAVNLIRLINKRAVN